MREIDFAIATVRNVDSTRQPIWSDNIMSAMMNEHSLPAEPEPGSRSRLLHFLTHERRCWRRLAYWLKQFQTEAGAPPRCYAWRRAPENDYPEDHEDLLLH
ncbi:hypothetical protein BI343_16655 [Chromobacterium amazonense]|nr:hypothetical protein BI343_16655 [Chromobacterium amazonense]